MRDGRDGHRAVPLGLILNEAVTNCVKHAFPGGEEGVVRITLRREGERLSLEVKDNGQGLPSSPDLDTAESMGFKLMKLPAGQLEGTLSVESAGGSTVAVSFGL